MAEGDTPNDLQTKATLMFGSPMGMAPDPISAHQVGSALSGLWDLVSGPSRILSGELQPTMTPGPNQLSIPEYAGSLALTGLGVRGLGFAPPEGALPSFPAWHGTGAQPFREFSDEHVGSGEGAQVYGWGHYVAGAQKTGEIYQRNIAGGGPVILDERGFPTSEDETMARYYTPGSIVPRMGGGYDKVISFNLKGQFPGDWNVDVHRAHLDINQDEVFEKMRKFYGGDPTVTLDFMNRPDLWKFAEDEGPRNIEDYPGSYAMAQVAAARGWKLGKPGGLLNIEVKPDEHELLDLDLPWKHQDPAVKAKLEAVGISPQDAKDFVPFISQRRNLNLDDITGKELYNATVGKRFAQSNDIPDFDEVKKGVSKEMDAAGVPGLKYLDQVSRDQGLALVHSDNFAGMPGDHVAENTIKGRSADAFSLDDVVKERLRMLKREADTANDYYQNYDPGPKKDASLARLQGLNAAMDWVRNEHAAGKFSLHDDRTRNYVIFDPKNLDIKSWSGVPMTPVEGDPFATTPEAGLQ